MNILNKGQQDTNSVFPLDRLNLLCAKRSGIKSLHCVEPVKKPVTTMVTGFFDMLLSAWAYFLEKVTVNLVPAWGELVTAILPPWASAMLLAMDSPRP